MPIDITGHITGIIACDTDLTSSYNETCFLVGENEYNMTIRLHPRITAALASSSIASSSARKSTIMSPTGMQADLPIDILCTAPRSTGELSNSLCESFQTMILNKMLLGVNTAVILYGNYPYKYKLMLDPLNGLFPLLVQGLVLNEKQLLIGINLTCTVSCAEIHREKVKDVIAFRKNSNVGFVDAKVTHSPPYVDLALQWDPLDEGVMRFLIDRYQVKSTMESSLVIQLKYVIKDYGVQRFATVMLVVVADAIVKNTPTMAFFSVLDTLCDNLKKSKTKQLVPYRLSILTNMIQEALSGSCKTAVIACLDTPGTTEADESNAMAILLASRARALSLILRQNQEMVPIHEFQREMARLRTRLDEINTTKAAKQNTQQLEQYNAMQEKLQNQCQALQTERNRKEDDYALVEASYNAREAELQSAQQKLNDRLLTAAEAERIRGEVQKLQEEQQRTQRQLAEQRQIVLIREVELREARELEQQVERLKAQQERQRKEAVAQQKATEAQAMADLFRGVATYTANQNLERNTKLKMHAYEACRIQLQKSEKRLTTRIEHIKALLGDARRETDAEALSRENIKRRIEYVGSLSRMAVTETMLAGAAALREEAVAVRKKTEENGHFSETEIIAHKEQIEVLRKRLEERKNELVAIRAEALSHGVSCPAEHCVSVRYAAVVPTQAGSGERKAHQDDAASSSVASKEGESDDLNSTLTNTQSHRIAELDRRRRRLVQAVRANNKLRLVLGDTIRRIKENERKLKRNVREQEELEQLLRDLRERTKIEVQLCEEAFQRDERARKQISYLTRCWKILQREHLGLQLFVEQKMNVAPEPVATWRQPRAWAETMKQAQMNESSSLAQNSTTAVEEVRKRSTTPRRAIPGFLDYLKGRSVSSDPKSPMSESISSAFSSASSVRKRSQRRQKAQPATLGTISVAHPLEECVKSAASRRCVMRIAK